MTDDASLDPWAEFDALLGIDSADPVDNAVGPVAFYGRCSTEDHQDPATSRAWQLGNARAFVEPLGGTVAAEFFDIGQSRSVPWERRDHASRLLAALKDPRRGWGGIVVGEGTRCWFGTQFALTAPRIAAYGVQLWVPELGGRFDARNPSHKMLMSVLGGMSEAERQHVQARVRAAMDAQVITEGRHQGGRAPYGYLVVDGGPHPHPGKAAEGRRLRVLVLDEPAAAVVRRIFAEYLDGHGDRAIAEGLNRDGVPCPSARRPEQNTHRKGDGWPASTVRAILENPRYTGFAVFGRWTRHEVLINPDDVAAGHVMRFARAAPNTIVRSRWPAHPKIVSVHTFTQAQLRRQARAAGGLPAIAKRERRRTTGKHTYRLRGLVRCGSCGRKMHGAATAGHPTYYRCVARTLPPDAVARSGHPRTVQVREDVLLTTLNAWLARLFTPPHLDQTISVLADSQSPDQHSADLTAAQIKALAASLGDIGAVLHRAAAPVTQRLYEALRYNLTYHPDTKAIDISPRPSG